MNRPIGFHKLAHPSKCDCKHFEKEWSVKFKPFCKPPRKPRSFVEKVKMQREMKKLMEMMENG